MKEYGHRPLIDPDTWAVRIQFPCIISVPGTSVILQVTYSPFYFEGKRVIVENHIRMIND